MKNKKVAISFLMAMATACAISAATATKATPAGAAGEAVFHELGASVRVSEDKGIRFAFGLPEDKTGNGYEIGTLIVPKAVLGDAELNHNDDTADEVDVDYEKIDCSKTWLPNDELPGAQAGYKYYNAALTEIPTVQYNTVLVARSYYVKDGVYTYSDPVERSIGYVAAAALNDGYNDTNEILANIVKTGYGDTALTIEGASFASTGDVEAFTASNDKGYLPVWSTSNADIATVDKKGNVTIVRGGEVTIKATIGNTTVEKTIYAVGAGLYADQIGVRINGWNFSGDANYLTVSGDNGNMVVTSHFQASAEYAPGLIIRNMYSKAYYEALKENGYTKFTFGLQVEGDVTDLYVFGKALNTFPQKDGVYQIVIDTNQFASYYETMSTLATDPKQVGQASSLSAKFIAWKSPADDYKSVRDYTFTLSNVAFTKPTVAVEFAEGSKDVVTVGETTTLIAETNMNSVEWSSSDEAIATVVDGVVKGVKGGEVTITATTAGVSASKTIYVVGAGLYSDQIGLRNNGYQQQHVADSFNMAVGENGDMTITAKLSDSAAYYPMLMLRNMYSKAYYQHLVENGYKKLTFMLGVGGANAADVSDLYVFGKALTSFPKDASGAYAIAINVEYIVTYYDNIYGIATTGNQAGQSGSLDKMFIAWKSPLGWKGSRNYVFTISNAMFNEAATLAVDCAEGSEATIVAGNTTTLVATSNWDASLVKWTSSDETIATVVDGVVTGVVAGEVTITATLDDAIASKKITVVAPTLEVNFATEGKDMIDVDGTTTLIATTDGNVDNVEWTTSNATIATVVDGVVTGVKGGEVTITATLAGVSASKTVYVVGAGLYSDQIGLRNNGYQQQHVADSFNMAVGENGDMTITAKLSDSAAYYPMLMLRNMYSKAYYQHLVENGYKKLTFMLGVGGANAADVSDLYVFGKALTSFPKGVSGAYAITIDVEYIVTYYDNIYGIATTGNQAGQSGSLDKMFIAWKSPLGWKGSRNYVFTISDAQFRPEATLEVSTDTSELVLNGETTIDVQTNWTEDFVTWSTSDSKIATVENGKVTVTGENWGEVIITATIAGVSKEVKITVATPELLEIAEDGSDIVEANEELILDVTTDWNEERIEWSSSDDSIATVANGVVTGLKSGIVTITAKLGDLTAEKTVCVVGGLNSDQIGLRNNGYQQQHVEASFNMAVGENGDMTITAMLSDSAAYYPMLMLRNMHSKAYYQHLVENGYKKLTFMLGVGGANAADVSDLYVFGKALTSFPKGVSGAYAITIDVEYIVTYYDNIYGLATTGNQAGQSGSLDKMFIAWKSPLGWKGSRNYVFTLSNVQYAKGVLFAENIGMRVNGYNVTNNTSHMTMDIGENGEMIIGANFQASWENYHAGLVWNNIQSADYYTALVNDGYKYITFDLKVDGTDKDKLSDLYVFCGQQLTTIEQVDGVYKVKILISDIPRVYDAITTYLPNDERKGQTGSRHGMFLAWRDNRDSDKGKTRNYIFTISNTAYAKA